MLGGKARAKESFKYARLTLCSRAIQCEASQPTPSLGFTVDHVSQWCLDHKFHTHTGTVATTTMILRRILAFANI